MANTHSGIRKVPPQFIGFLVTGFPAHLGCSSRSASGHQTGCALDDGRSCGAEQKDVGMILVLRLALCLSLLLVPWGFALQSVGQSFGAGPDRVSASLPCHPGEEELGIGAGSALFAAPVNSTLDGTPGNHPGTTPSLWAEGDAARSGEQQQIELHPLPQRLAPSDLNGVTFRGEGQNQTEGTTFKPAQSSSLYSNDAPRQEHYLRAALETTSFLGLGIGVYWWKEGYMRTDFDYSNPAESLRARFVTGTAYRFDDNQWGMNIGHVWAGTGLYTLGRSNNLNIYESALLTAAASFFWEYGVEYGEVVSLNDMIVTPLSGLTIGEVMFQLGDFFQHGSDTPTNKALGLVFGGPTAFHRWLDNNKPKAPPDVDRFGFTTDVWHRFRLSAGAGAGGLSSSGSSRPEAEFGCDLELVLADKYQKPGTECSLYTNGVFDQLSLKTTLAEDGVVDFQFLARTAFWGWYQQDIVKDRASEQLDGYSLLIGIGSAFEYLTHDFSGISQIDKQAIFDLPGPILLWDTYRQGFHIRSLTDIYPNFAMVMPYTAEEFKENFQTYGKSVFQSDNYYYAFGLTAGTSLEMTYKRYEFDLQARFYLFNSINDELNRFPIGFGLQDRRLSLRAGLGYALPIENTKIFVNAERLFRWSQIGDFNSDQDETRILGRFVFEF
jgi:hypothetical protein